MKTKLLKQINFQAIEPMSDKQMVELNGGGLKELLKGLLEGSTLNGYCPTTNYCPPPKQQQ